MQFRDLQKQYEVLKPEMDAAMIAVASGAHFISGEQVKTLEERLAAYVGRKHCITCGNGTDALELCMMAWGIGPGDAVFVPDFTFFASGETVSTVGGTPVFYDVCADTFNADAKSLEAAIEAVIAEGKLTPKAVVDVDLFGLPADHEAVAAVCKKHGVWCHTDAVQAVGAIPIDVQDLGVDMLSMSGHKFNAPKGIGALYIRRGILPYNLIDGGGQEGRRRAGTENVAGIAGIGKALEMATGHLEEKMAHQRELRDYTINRILKNIPLARLNGSWENRLPGNVNISFPGLEGETILLDLDMHGICASTGSACNSDSLDPSHVLLSIGLPEEIGHGSMRFTFGPQTTMEEAEYLCQTLEEIIPRRRAMSCMWLQNENTVRDFNLKK